MGLDPKHGSSLRDKLPDFDSVKDKMPDRSTFRGSSGAEQDRYRSHFNLDFKNLPDGSTIREKAHDISSTIWEKMPSKSSFRGSSGAEQDRYGSHFDIDPKDLPDIPSKSEIRSKLFDTNFFENTSGTEQDSYGSHLGIHGHSYLNTTTVGLLQSTILPSFGLHSGLSIIAYGIARYTNRVEVKDILWPAATLLNAWYSAIGLRFLSGASLPSTLGSLTYTQKLLLGGVTAWASRLLYRVVSRSISRRKGSDDAQYEIAKTEKGFWDNALFKMFIPEAIVQTLITLPLVLPLRAPYASAAASPAPPVSADLVHGLAIFLFTSGMALELSADAQLDAQSSNDAGLEKEGVWSIVRHPK
jgi:steroid 5-alpha reductase family enzyme